MVDVLSGAGHDIVGLTASSTTCRFGPERRVTAVRKDVRDVAAQDLAGFDAVIHLAASERSARVPDGGARSTSIIAEA
jgi:nucleoside-diphosphate-sugar epimerase